jgi:hypothetical protein
MYVYIFHSNKTMDYLDDLLTARQKESMLSIVTKAQFISHSIEVKIIPPDGGSFMGVLREVTIRGKAKSGYKELHLFIKTIIPDVKLSIYSITEAYRKEAFAYTELFKVFEEIQQEFKVPIAERFQTAKGYDETDMDSIIMENLLTKGFKMCNRMEKVTLKFAELALQQLAKFHGLSIVIQEKRGNYFKERVKTLRLPFSYGQPSWNEFIDNVSNLGKSCLEPEVRKRVEKYWPTTYEKYKYFATDPQSMRCLVHGDYRTNNIMVKMDVSMLRWFCF